MTIDFFDFFAFFVLGVLFLSLAGVVVGLGSLPGWIARNRNHPQAAAVNIASWVGVATLGVFWPLALIWAFMEKPDPAAAAPSPHGSAELAKMQARLAEVEATLRELNAKKKVPS